MEEYAFSKSKAAMLAAGLGALGAVEGVAGAQDSKTAKVQAHAEHAMDELDEEVAEERARVEQLASESRNQFLAEVKMFLEGMVNAGQIQGDKRDYIYDAIVRDLDKDLHKIDAAGKEDSVVDIYRKRFEETKLKMNTNAVATPREPRAPGVQGITERSEQGFAELDAGTAAFRTFFDVRHSYADAMKALEGVLKKEGETVDFNGIKFGKKNGKFYWGAGGDTRLSELTEDARLKLIELAGKVSTEIHKKTGGSGPNF